MDLLVPILMGLVGGALVVLSRIEKNGYKPKWPQPQR